MIVLRDSSPVGAEFAGGVLALGNFDGLHTGHVHVIEEATRLAARAGRKAGIVTFEPHPRRLLRPELPPLRLLSLSDKLRRLRLMRLDMVRLVRFTHAFSRMSAAAFISDMLEGQMKVAHVVTGDDFIFGHNREGDVEFLRKEAQQRGFGFTACAPVTQGQERCSSSRIRALLADGEVGKAAGMLGRPYSITGRVQEGEKRGRLLGFPTANIVPAHLFTPATGVYAVRARLDGVQVGGVANLGVRPTFAGSQLRLETHFFDWSGNLYGRRIEVDCIRRIREERTFSGMDALQRQIRQDAQAARAILQENN